MGSYFGSKATSGLCQPIIALMPPHDTYIETHLGGGAIMKRKPPALHNIGIDLNPRALAAFECDYPVKKVNDCAHRFLAEYDYGGRELIYSDPPYLHHTRTSGRRYRFDYEEQDHIELLELLKTLPCNVILSGYPSALYDERLAGWRTLELQVMNHAQACLRPRDRFWDIPVPKIDSAFDNLLVPQPSWSPSTTQQLRKLVAAPYLAPI